MIDRTQQPPINTIDTIKVQNPTLQNIKGLPVYIINMGSQDVVRLEFIYKAGYWFADNHFLTAKLCNDLLNEGTVNKTSEIIAEELEYYGAYLELNLGRDWASLVLYSLNKHLDKTLPIVDEILTQANFPEHEIKIYVDNAKQKLKTKNKKVNYLARKHFARTLFGQNHPYGYFPEKTDYDQITRKDLINFFQQKYTRGDLFVTVAGKCDEKVLNLLNKYLSERKEKQPTTAPPHIPTNTDKQTIFVEQPDALQNAIRIGRRMFTKTHPDFMKMEVLNMLLGGYFGSRLMTNIREDKGYTYGISSGLASYAHEGFWVISTEVGKDVWQQAIDEIYKEIRRLQTEPISQEEMTIVKNYMLGNLLKETDGAFVLAEQLKNLLLNNQDFNYYTNLANTIKSITSEEINTLANQYLQEKDLIEVVVGSK